VVDPWQLKIMKEFGTFCAFRNDINQSWSDRYHELEIMLQKSKEQEDYFQILLNNANHLFEIYSSCRYHPGEDVEYGYDKSCMSCCGLSTTVNDWSFCYPSRYYVGCQFKDGINESDGETARVAYIEADRLLKEWNQNSQCGKCFEVGHITKFCTWTRPCHLCHRYGHHVANCSVGKLQDDTDSMIPTNDEQALPSSSSSKIIKVDLSNHDINARPGDWLCYQCKSLNFKSRQKCFKCQITKQSSLDLEAQEVRLK
jgi:hypothetical protein